MIKSILNRQKQEKYQTSKVPTPLSTVGIDISNISLKGINFNVWDFAGQMEYHNFHHVQYFGISYLF